MFKPRSKRETPQAIAPEQASHMPLGAFSRPVKQVSVPRFNRVYDTIRSDNTLLDFFDAAGSGSITTVAGSLVSSSNITLPAGAFIPLRLEQWPGAVQCYIAVTYFGIASQSSAPATIGNLQCYFIDNGGAKIPLANLMSHTAAQDTSEVICPTMQVDPNPSTLGNVAVQLNPGAATAVVVNFDIRFSFVYLLPSEYAHDIVDVVDTEGVYRP